MQESRSSGFPTRSDTKKAVHLQKQATGLKYWLLVEEVLYYRSSENKGIFVFAYAKILFSQDRAHLLSQLMMTKNSWVFTYEPRRKKTGLRGFRQGLTQTDLYSHRCGLEA